MGTAHAIKVGDWVEVLYEYALGTCSDGGIGEVIATAYNEEGRAEYTFVFHMSWTST
jgi:hypothetical protein